MDPALTDVCNDDSSRLLLLAVDPPPQAVPLLAEQNPEYPKADFKMPRLALSSPI